MLSRLIANWVYGGFLAGLLLVLLEPVLTRSWAPALAAVFLQLPVYMLHQYEEHDHDRLFVKQDGRAGQTRPFSAGCVRDECAGSMGRNRSFP